jgi:hypothetical protein
MAHQHNPLAASPAGPQLAESTLALGRQHRLDIGQPIPQTLGSWKRPFAREGVLDGGRVATWMFQQHHRPALLRQSGRQPIELFWITAKARHQQQPGPHLWIGTGPKLQRQWCFAMGYRQLQPPGQQGCIGR